MIFYDGITKKDKVSFIKFKNDLGKSVAIPMPEKIVDMIEVYLNKLQPPEPKPVERGNDEDSA